MLEEENKSNAGRKWFDGKDEKEVLSKLKEVWVIGGTDLEASLWAEISTSSLSRYLKENPELKELRDKLKQTLTLKSRMNIAREIDKGLDPDISKWYLERKKKDEFSSRQEMTGEEGEPIKTEFIYISPNDGAEKKTSEVSTNEKTG